MSTLLWLVSLNCTVNMQDAKDAAEYSTSENGATDSGAKPNSELNEKAVQMYTDSKGCCWASRFTFLFVLVPSSNNYWRRDWWVVCQLLKFSYAHVSHSCTILSCGQFYLMQHIACACI